MDSEGVGGDACRGVDFGTGRGYAEVIAGDAPPGELPSEATLSRGENELSSLFGGPGEYLLKLNQFLGTPPSAYTVVLE